MSTTQAADHFDVHQKTIQRWIRSGKLSADMVDGRWRVHVGAHRVPDEEPCEEHHMPDEELSEGHHVPDEDFDVPNAEHDALIQEHLKRTEAKAKHLQELLNEKDNRIQQLAKQLDQCNAQLDRRDDQIESLTQALDHAQQLAAMSQKQSAALTERVEALEDLRARPWWRKWFGHNDTR